MPFGEVDSDVDNHYHPMVKPLLGYKAGWTVVGTIDFKSKNFLMRKILQRGECRAYSLKEVEVNYYENLLSFLGE